MVGSVVTSAANLIGCDSWHLVSAADLQSALHSYAYSQGHTTAVVTSHAHDTTRACRYFI